MKKQFLVAAGALLMPALALAEPAASIVPADTAWMLVACALVLFMTIPGLSLFYGGLVRSKNVLSVLMQCFALTSLMSILWIAIGYSIAYSPYGVTEGLKEYFGNAHYAFMNHVNADVASTVYPNIPESVFSMFQMTFAVITPALVVGAFVERIKFSSMLIFSSAWMLLVYAPVCRWIWNSGWLANYDAGVMDFAGGIVVHITAGVAAVVAAVIIGRRRDFPGPTIRPHNMTLTIAGAGMLWVGWFGFNGGSAVAADGNAGMAILVTHISAAAGTFSWMMCEWVMYRKPSALGAVTGMVAGLGTITPAANMVSPAGALLLGLLAGVVCFFATMFIKNKLKIDDSLDVFPVHGVGGILGSLMVAILASPNLGLIGGYGEHSADTPYSIADNLWIQFVGVGSVFVYTAIVTTVLLLIIKLIFGLRVDEDAEQRGLDISDHEERGYDL